MDLNLLRINHLVDSQAALTACIHIHKLVPKAGLEPAAIGFSTQHSTNLVTSAKTFINAVSLTLPVTALAHWVSSWLWLTWPLPYHLTLLHSSSSDHSLTHGDLLGHFRVAALHFDALVTINTEVIEWRFAVREKTLNDVFYLLFANNHPLALHCYYISIWRGWSES